MAKAKAKRKKAKPPQRNRGQKITLAKREEMFQAYCNRPVVESVAKVCRVSPGSVRRYRVSDGWEKRRKGIVKRVQKKIDKTAAERLADDLTRVRMAKSKLLNQIVGGEQKIGDKTVVVKPTKSKTPFADLDRIIRLERYLEGEPDSRAGVVFSDFTDAELRQFIEKNRG